jgi:hypothetical protein
MATRKKKSAAGTATGTIRSAPAIRKLLAKKEELLEEFEAMYGDGVPYEEFAEWAQGEGPCTGV